MLINNKILFLADSSGEYGKDIKSSLPQLINRLKEEVDQDIKIGITQINPEHFLEYEEEMILRIRPCYLSKNVMCRYWNEPRGRQQVF